MALLNKDSLEKHRSSKMESSETGAFGSKFGMHAVLLSANTHLYKFSGNYPFDDRHQHWSPWWNARSGTRHTLANGQAVSWTGLSSRLTSAMNGNYSETKEARVRSAVKYEWNSMQNLFIAALRIPAWAWFGQCKGQRVSENDPQYSKVYLIGGDYQYYIPSLERNDLHILSVHSSLDQGHL